MSMIMNNGGEFGKYINQETREPGYVTEAAKERFYGFGKWILYMDTNVVPGAFQMNTAWFTGETPEGKPGEHYHDYPELLGYFSSDPDDPEDLGAEVGFSINGEEHLLTKSAMIFLPAGVKHSLPTMKNLKRPVFHFSTCPIPEYTRDKPAEPVPEDADVVMNNGGEYGKYIIQHVHVPSYFTEHDCQNFASFAKRIIYMDSNVVPGAFQMGASWYYRPIPDGGPGEHTHSFPEILGFYSSDPDDPDDLGAEIEFNIEGETHLLTKSSLIFMPAGVKHLPMTIKNVRRPFLHFGVCLSPEYAADPTGD